MKILEVFLELLHFLGYCRRLLDAFLTLIVGVVKLTLEGVELLIGRLVVCHDRGIASVTVELVATLLKPDILEKLFVSFAIVRARDCEKSAENNRVGGEERWREGVLRLENRFK